MKTKLYALLIILFCFPGESYSAKVVDVTRMYIGNDGYEFAPIAVREYIDGKPQVETEFWVFKIYPTDWCKEGKQEILFKQLTFGAGRKGFEDGNVIESQQFDVFGADCSSNEWSFTIEGLGYPLQVYIKIQVKKDDKYVMPTVYLTDFKAVGVYKGNDGKPKNVEYRILEKAENKNVKMYFNGYLDKQI